MFNCIISDKQCNLNIQLCWIVGGGLIQETLVLWKYKRRYDGEYVFIHIYASNKMVITVFINFGTQQNLNNYSHSYHPTVSNVFF